MARSIVVLVMALLLTTGGPLVASSQLVKAGLSPVPGSDRLDLAAMALPAVDLPPDFVLEGEGYFSVEEIAQTLTPWLSVEEIAASGVRLVYESLYVNADGQAALRSYFAEYGSAAEAEAGFALFEDEGRLPPDFAPLSHEDLPGPGVGSDPAEITYETYTYGSGLPEGQYVDATFRVGRLLVGVALDAPYAGAPAMPPAVDQAAVAMVSDLAAVLHERTETVLAGETPAGIDLSLPGTLLPPDPAWGASEEGYLAGGEELSGFGLLASDPEFRAAYVRASSVGEPRPAGSGMPPNGSRGQPHVVVGVASFASAAGAADALSRARTGGLTLPPGGPRDLVGEPVIAGAEAAVADRASALPLPGVAADSFGVAMTIGDYLVAVAVVGTPEAETAAMKLAERQVTCLAGGACPSVEEVTLGMSAATAVMTSADEGTAETLIGATVDVPGDAFAGLFRIDYAPGAVEGQRSDRGPILNLVTAGTLVISLDGPAVMLPARSPAELEQIAAGTEVTLGLGDGLIVPAETQHAIRNDGETPAVLLAAVLMPSDAPPPLIVDGLRLRTLGFGPPPAPGANAVALDRVTLSPGAELPPPPIFAVVTGDLEQTPEGGLRNIGNAEAVVLTLTYGVAEEPAPADAGSTPAATPAT